MSTALVWILLALLLVIVFATSFLLLRSIFRAMHKSLELMCQMLLAAGWAWVSETNARTQILQTEVARAGHNGEEDTGLPLRWIKISIGCPECGQPALEPVIHLSDTRDIIAMGICPRCGKIFATPYSHSMLSEHLGHSDPDPAPSAPTVLDKKVKDDERVH